MKIVMFIYSLSGGGAERVMVSLANYWVQKNNEVSIFTIKKDNQIAYNLHKKIKICSLGIDTESNNFTKAFLFNIKRINIFSNVMKKEQPDIVISFNTTANILTTIAAKITNTPIIISERTYHKRVQTGIWKFLSRLTYPLSNGLVVLSPEDYEYYNFHPNRIIIKNPIGIQPPTNIKLEEKENIILGVGRLHKVKGFDMLIEAFAKTQNKNWKLIILGEGSERKNLETLIYKFKLSSKIKLVGQVNDVHTYYKKASLFVLSSRNEGFPNALVEAMAYGCAPISFDCKTGPNTIIKQNDNGVLIEAANIEMLSKELNCLMNNKEKRLSYGKKAMEISKELNISSISKQWEQFIENILGKKNLKN
ncbi:glycosyltransferase family 4 protein [Hydrogenimonas urashimensis]|uniref:glycosyltransferase family 4 protein n=1 Tax=Hydrogenimonas urashimensis TaxID=2740515 RepID=UPI001915586E|nr:glycosyltransferase family 4 protein [Hydrogenimonas urashimensis]